MGKVKKIIIGIIVFIIAVVILLIGVYFAEFKPSIATTPISGQIQLNKDEIFQQFIPTNVDLSATGISAQSEIKISLDDLTNLIAYTMSKEPNAKDYIKGIKITSENNKLIMYVNVDKFGIPFQAKAVFDVLAQNGKAILHFDSAKVGFISISKNIIFSRLKSNKFIECNQDNGDIILNPLNLSNIEITKFDIQNNDLDMQIKGTINFF